MTEPEPVQNQTKVSHSELTRTTCSLSGLTWSTSLRRCRCCVQGFPEYLVLRFPKSSDSSRKLCLSLQAVLVVGVLSGATTTSTTRTNFIHPNGELAPNEPRFGPAQLDEIGFSGGICIPNPPEQRRDCVLLLSKWNCCSCSFADWESGGEQSNPNIGIERKFFKRVVCRMQECR